MSFPLEGRPKIPDPGYVNLLNVPRALTGCMGASQKKRTGFIENRHRKNDRNQAPNIRSNQAADPIAAM